MTSWHRICEPDSDGSSSTAEKQTQIRAHSFPTLFRTARRLDVRVRNGLLRHAVSPNRPSTSSQGAPRQPETWFACRSGCNVMRFVLFSRENTVLQPQRILLSRCARPPTTLVFGSACGFARTPTVELVGRIRVEEVKVGWRRLRRSIA